MENIDDKKSQEIDQIAQSIRPKILNNVNVCGIYEKLNLFVISYNFLRNIDNKTENKEIKDKIKNNKELFDILYKKWIDYNNSSLSIMKKKIFKNVSKIIYQNNDKISNFIIFCYSIGKKSIIYDPDIYAGIED